MTVVLGRFHRLWIRNLFDESWADVLRLVELFTTVRATVTRNSDLLIWIGRRPQLGIMAGFSTRFPAVSARFFIVLVSVR